MSSTTPPLRNIFFIAAFLAVLTSRVVTAQAAKPATDVATLAPTATAPVCIPATDQASHHHWAEQIDRYMNLPALEVTAHPTAADFPGAVPPSAPILMNQEVTVALNMPRWHSTGLYAPPGARITIRVAPEDTGRGLSVRIGSHTDSLMALEKWVRFPQITRRFPITQEVTTVANAFGGLIYIDVPRNKSLGGWNVPTHGGYGWLDEDPRAVPGVVKLHIDGAVAAPLFIVGQTTPEQWKLQLAERKAPWGELQSDKIILTVQTQHLSAADDPTALLAFWDKVVDAEAQLAGWPRQPAPPERIVFDRDLSAGWMHSGYPIMAHLSTARDALKLTTLQTKGDWGFFHELGHNHQAQAYTFGGDYTEVNVNLFSMYVMQTVVGREMTAHPNLLHVDALLDARLGPNKTIDPWCNLAMYIKTIEAFGWKPLQETMASYSTRDGSAGISTREQKMDQWVLRYSKATGHNLVEYYALFDVTCSDSTKSALKDLPMWLPPELEKYQTTSLPVIPLPSAIVASAGQFAIDRKTTIAVDSSASDVRATAEFLSRLLAAPLGAGPPLNKATDAPIRGAILLTTTGADPALGEEGYELNVAPTSTVIRARTSAGLFYGVQTLRQLLPPDIESTGRRLDVLNVPCVSIKDSPRFAWRGLMLDVSRHFFDKQEIKKYLDLMALFKLNVFHWHLTDDQGWRIEIKKYPKLTEIGAWRDQIGFGLDPKRSTHFDARGRYGGFYTQDDIREIVAYAATLHITIVPEIEMPGHAQAALAAYPQFSSSSGAVSVGTSAGVMSSIYNAGDDKTFDFLQDILSEVMELFPSKYIHIGGDEVPKGPWHENAQCQARMKAEGLKTEDQLQSYFVKRMERFVGSKGRHLIGWDEILEGGLAPGAAVMSWRGIGGGVAAAQAGHDVVLSPNSDAYLDHYQSRAPGQPKAIGGYLPLQSVYAFNPIPAQLSPEQARHILGVQGNVWTEYMPDMKQVEYMTYPRACAMAEVGWSQQSPKNLNDFLARLKTQKDRLKALAVNFFDESNLAAGVVGGWEPAKMSEKFVELNWDATHAVTKPGKYRVTMQYSGGKHRLDIAWVSLLEDGKEIARDTHDGRTGETDHENNYVVTLPNLKDRANYSVRAQVRSDGGTDSSGKVFVVPVP